LRGPDSYSKGNFETRKDLQMTEKQKHLLSLVAENMFDYLKEKYYNSNQIVDKQNVEDIAKAIFEFENE
jgi:hypothetical protein